MFSRFRIRRSLSLVLEVLLVALAVSASQSHAASRVAPLITKPVDNTSLVKLGGGTHPLANAQNDRGAVTPSQPMNRMMMVLKRPEAQDKALAAAIKEMQRPGSKTFHHWLTAEQIGEQYGAAPEDVAKVTGWLTSSGFQVNSVSKARSVVEFSGTAAQVASAFHTEMHHYAWKGNAYTANSSDPQIPAALAPVVAGFAAMNNFPIKGAHSDSKVVQLDKNTHTWTVPEGTKTPGGSAGKGGVRPALTTTHTGDGQTLYGVTPYDFATIYNLKPLWDAGLDGTGQQIAVVAESDISTGDVDQFRSAFGLPDKHLNIVHNGDAPGLLSDQDEASIDVEWAGAIAKNATIDLVVSSSTAVSAGIYLSMTYAVDNLTAPVLSESYQTCESALGPAGNLFFYQTWQQAAAEGITVVVSSGDSAAAACDIDPFQISSNGLAVNGFASTPYNVAVGGTDFAVNITNPTPYWGATNDPTTQASALSYIPEVPWNNSCASPEVFAAFSGGSGDSSPAQWCDDFQLPGNYLTPEGGGGGASSCTSFDPAAYPTRAYCAAGYAKPEWQAGVNGIPDDKVRDVPDVSLFGSYLTFGSAYLYCMTDPTYVQSCNYDTPDGLKYLASGGTSFGAPAFAGIMALINQKTNSSQGLANYYLYTIGGQEFGSTESPNTSQTNACRAGSSPGAANSCSFYDVTEGTNALPCFITSWDCINGPNGYAGVLAAYGSTPGYDRVTGLGSINVENLVNNWATLAAATQPTTTTLTASTTLSSYGQPITFSGTVAPVSGSGTPPGTVSIQGMQQSQASINLTNGTYSQAVASLPPGAYDVTANYVGDGGYLNSNSSPISVTVAAGTPTDSLVFSAANVRTGAALPSSNGAIPYGDQVVATVTVQGPPAAPGVLPPTGSVTFSAGGTVLSTVPLTSTAAGMTATYQTVAGHIASYTMTASYSGDANYNPIAALTAPYTEVQAPTSIEAHASASTVATGDTVNLIANVFSNSYAAPPSGSVTFTLNGTVIGTSRLASGADPLTGVGIASTTFPVPASAIADGNNQIVATYSGDDNFLGSTAAPSSFISLSGQYPTQMSLTASSTTATNLTPVTLVATLTVNGTPATTGSIRFLDNGITIAQVPVVGLTPAAGMAAGTATLVTRLTPGNHTIVGIYSGAGNVLHPTGGAAPPITVTAAQQSVTTTISATNDVGTPANYDVTALVVAGGITAPTGTLTLQEPSLGVSLANVALDQNKAVSGPSPEIAVTTGSQSGLVITGDFNGDGIPDFAATSMNLATQLMVSLGVGDGTFKPAVGSVVSTDPTVTGAYGLVTGDFNADGIADIAVSFASGNTMVVMLGKGDGTFQQGQALSIPPIGSASSSVLGNLVTADFNGDGIQDIALFNGGNYIGNIEVFFGVGDGSFGRTPTIIASIGDYDSTNAPDNLVVGDLNNDGKPDLVAFIQLDGEVATFLGNGDGTFQSEVTYASGNGTTSGAVGDLNHDGFPDIVAPNRADQNIAVFLNNQDGTFASPVTYNAASIFDPPQYYYPEPFSVALADMNNDGDLDVAIANNHINQVSILYGKSNGSFQQYTPKLINTAPGPFQVVVADLNGDGTPDILVEEPTSGTVGAMLNGQTWTTTMLNVPLYGAATEMETMTATYSGDPANLTSTSAPLTLPGSGSKIATKLDWTPAIASGVFGATIPAGSLNAQVEHSVPGTIAYSAQTAMGTTIPVAAGDTLPGAGTYALTAAFTPASPTDYSPSTDSVAFTVTKASVAETLTASATQSAPGVAVTLTDTVVSSTSTTTTPTGIVTFYAGTTSLGSAPLDGTGVASISTASLPAGTASVTASYLGDGNFNPGTAAAVSVIVGTPGIALSVGEPSMTLTAGSSAAETVAATAQLGYTGNVTFACGSLPAGVNCLFAPATGAVGAAALQSTMTVSILAPASGSTTQSAIAGSRILAASSAAVASIFLIGFMGRRRRMTWLVVLLLTAGGSVLIGCSGGGTKVTTPISPAGPDATTLALSSSAIKSASGSFVTLTAKLAGTNASAATGSVTFYDGTTQIGEANLASGSATLSLNTLSVGAHGITAKYAGDSLNQSSTSGSGFEQVITGQTTFTVTATSGTISQSSVVNLTLQ
jgi:Pro-kumamolisin, activation domain/Bacterial Ig-like domain (group 3)/FG-GAP-like repeat